MDEITTQTVGIALGFVLSLMIYSYLLGDNPLYRLAVHVLVGVGLGYASVVAIYTVLIPQLIAPFAETGAPIQPIVAFIALLALLLLLKLFRQTAVIGNLTMGFVMGVGAAVAISGALLGTLLPQASAATLPLLPNSETMTVSDLLLAALVLMTGTITSLLYFHFSAQLTRDGRTQRPLWVHLSAQVGQVFLMITFGSLFAGALIASLSVLTARLQFYIQWLSQWIV